jgi:hypothetical protein
MVKKPLMAIEERFQVELPSLPRPIRPAARHYERRNQ